MAERLRDLPNLGPASEKMLHAAGIDTIDQLTQLGAVTSYQRVCAAKLRPSMNLLWAIAGALSHKHWAKLTADERTTLLFQLDAQHDKNA